MVEGQRCAAQFGAKAVWGVGVARAVWLHAAPVSHPSPRVGACAPVWAEAVKSAVCSGFVPVKALVKWLPLPQCHDRTSFWVRLGAWKTGRESTETDRWGTDTKIRDTHIGKVEVKEDAHLASSTVQGQLSATQHVTWLSWTFGKNPKSPTHHHRYFHSITSSPFSIMV